MTEQGAALAQDWTSGYEVAAEELFSPLSEEQMTTLVDILRVLGAEERSPAGD